MKAVFLDRASLGPNLDLTELETLLPELTTYNVTANDDVASRIKGAGIVLGNKARITAPIIADSPELRFIGITATGTDNIDLVAAERHGVAVANIRAYCTESVVEHVFGCLLNLSHNLQAFNQTVRAGLWQSADDFCLLAHPIRELSGMTLGIVGYGELGRGVARIGEAFGMQVIVSARPGTDKVADDRVAFDELLRRADVVSLHCPLNDATRNLIDGAALRQMKRTAILINTARGGLIDSAALVGALESGEIAAAAVDVLPQEPPIDGDPLLDYLGDNLMITPHIAWGSQQARQAAIDELAANVRSFQEGGRRNRLV